MPISPPGGFWNFRIIQKLREEGFPQGRLERAQLNRDLEQWSFTYLLREISPAFDRVATRLFETPYPGDARYFAYKLSRDHPAAFHELLVHVLVEFVTGRLAAQDKEMREIQDREEARRRTEAEEPPPVEKEYSRKQFYDLVWSKPCSELAAELGVSDVMIGKICKQYRIPKPYKGYWNQLYAGQNPRQTPLPQFDDSRLNSISFVISAVTGKSIRSARSN